MCPHRPLSRPKRCSLRNWARQPTSNKWLRCWKGCRSLSLQLIVCWQTQGRWERATCFQDLQLLKMRLHWLRRHRLTNFCKGLMRSKVSLSDSKSFLPRANANKTRCKQGLPSNHMRLKTSWKLWLKSRNLRQPHRIISLTHRSLLLMLKPSKTSKKPWNSNKPSWQQELTN